MDSATKKKITMGISILLLLVVFAFMYQQAKQTKLVDGLLLQLEQVRADLAQNNPQARQVSLQRTYKDIFTNCKDREIFNNYINEDSRTLSATRLKEALSLHGKCAEYDRNARVIALKLFEQDVRRLEGISTLLEGALQDADFSLLAKYWRDMYEFEIKHNKLLGDNIQIQKEYWERELDRQTGAINAKEREVEIGKLNKRASVSNAKITELIDELSKTRAKEATLWIKLIEENNL